MLSEALNAQLGRAFALIAELAPTLGEAELRVLIALTRLFGASEHGSGRASTRQLAELARISRRNVQHALAGLSQKSLIVSREGTATTPAGHLLTFLRVTQMGGAATTPPLAFSRPHPGAEETPQVALFERQGGATLTPPPIEERAGAGASIDSITSDSIIDRLLKADPRKTSREDLSHAKRWIHGYQLKFGRSENGQPYHPHEPDDTITAQLCAVLSPIQLENLIHELSAERKQPGHQYSWYVTVALQRRHGIAPAVLKARRSEMRIVRDRGRTLSGEQQQLPTAPAEAEASLKDADFARELIDEIGARRRQKGANQ